MIEEIQALMPLLERISDGAIWAFAIYMAVKLVTVLVWPIALIWKAVSAVPKIAKVFMAPKQEDRRIDLYDLSYRGLDAAEYLGDRKTLAKFLKWAVREDGRSKYIHESDLENIMAGKHKPTGGEA